MKTALLLSAIFFLHTFLIAQLSSQQKDVQFGHVCKQHNVFAKKSSYAVPLTAKVHHLKAEWRINPSFRFIEGSLQFQLSALVSDSLQLALHSQFQIDSVKINNVDAPFHFSNNVIKVSLQNSNGGIDTLSISYRGEPDSSSSSFVRDMYQDIPIIWTLSQPYGASDWWPNFQNLKEKIDSIDILIQVPTEYTAVSNGLLHATTNLQNDIVYHWKHRYPIPSYLIALAVSKYEVIRQKTVLNNGDSLLMEDYIFPDDSVQIAYNVGRIFPILKSLDSLLITYPFAREKYGHAQFTRSGGMEHTTISFINNYHKEILSHELAHHWFGNYITCASWQDIWLNEGFATYLSGKAYQYTSSDSLYTYWRELIKERVCAKPDGSVFVYDTSDVKRVFDARLSYNKAALVLVMLEYELGEELFFSALRNYLNDPELAYSFATTSQFKQHVENASGKNLDTFFNQWIYKEGYPQFTIQWSQSKGNLTVELTQKSSHPSNEMFEMKLPIRAYGHNFDTTLHVWVNQKQHTFSFDFEGLVQDLVLDPDSRVIAKSTRITQMFSQNDVFIFPNPANEFVQVVSAKPSERILNVRIYTLDGKFLSELKDVQQDKVVVDIQALESGSYVVLVETTGDSKTIKLIKQKF